MPLPTHRSMMLALCLLPAVGIQVLTPQAPLIATFMYACESAEPRPRLETRYLAAGKPVARPASALVESFEKGHAPARHYRVVGQVRVLASTVRTDVGTLKDWARKGARKLGGDALVELAIEDAASVVPKAGDVGLLYLTASVVRWE